MKILHEENYNLIVCGKHFYNTNKEGKLTFSSIIELHSTAQYNIAQHNIT